jgi:hypothetical protein
MSAEVSKYRVVVPAHTRADGTKVEGYTYERGGGRARVTRRSGGFTGTKRRSGSGSKHLRSGRNLGVQTGLARGVSRDETEGLGTKKNPIKVTSASEALDLIAEGKHVTMDPDTVGVVLEKLAEIGQKAFEAEKAGKAVDLPDYDLCRIHVPDTNLFCIKNKGIPRIKMPQVKGKNIRPGSKAAKLLAQQNEENGTPDNREVDGTAAFVAYLKDKGVTIKRNQTVPADKLKATQNQLVGSKVGGMMGARAAGKFDPAKDPIFVSTDNYVLDGHHRWAAVVGSQFAEGKPINMNTDVIDLPIQQLVDMTNEFLDDFGILPNAATATSKSWVDKARRELPCIGCGDESSLDDSFRHRDLLAKKDGRNYSIPSAKSTPKEIVGSHGHKPHGTSILWPALYEELRKKGYSKSKAAAISNAQWNKRHGKGAKNLASTRVTKAEAIEGVISKVDEDKQLVYGWMYVTHNRDGEVVVDKSGDFIDEIDELDEAVVDFVLHTRVGGIDHARDGDSPVQASRLVESIVFTPEKIDALGLQPGDLPTGWWAGWKVDDPGVWDDVKSGRYKSFSIHGSGLREPVTADITKKAPTGTDRRRMAAAYTGRQVRGARSGTLSSKERKQRQDAARASANKRRGSGTKDKNPKTPETKANERTRIRTETPGTTEHTAALGRLKRAITSGKPLKVREGEMDSIIERAKAQGLDYSESKGVVTIKLSDGRKLVVTSGQKEK